MLILKTKPFSRWMDDNKVTDTVLTQAIMEMDNGLFEANLGGYIYKKRIALAGQGKKGGARTILAYKTQDKAIFIFGYAKNAKGNITSKEEIALKALAKHYFSYDNNQLSKAIKVGELIEVQP